MRDFGWRADVLSWRIFRRAICGTRLVNAEWLLIEIVAGGGVGAGAAAHADIAEFAATAFAVEIVDVTQLVEDEGIFPDVGKALFLEIAGGGGKISAGVDLSLM